MFYRDYFVLPLVRCLPTIMVTSSNQVSIKLVVHDFVAAIAHGRDKKKGQNTSRFLLLDTFIW